MNCFLSGRQLPVPRRTADLSRRREMGSSQESRPARPLVGRFGTSLVRVKFINGILVHYLLI